MNADDEMRIVTTLTPLQLQLRNRELAAELSVAQLRAETLRQRVALAEKSARDASAFVKALRGAAQT
jgi:hypothetical protein